MVQAVRKLREHGIKTAMLTNNWRSDVWDQAVFKELPSLFDTVIESCEVGMRKPEPEIYTHTLEKLKMAASDVVFLDDIGSNVAAANKLGIQTIKVNDVSSALAELQELLGLDLGHRPGTSPVRPGMELDPEPLKDYLCKLGYSADDLSIKQFSHGQSNPTYLLCGLEGTNLVLRKKPPGKLLPGAHAVEREFQVMSALGKSGVPVPKLIDLCHDVSVVGTPFYIMEYVDGRILKDPSLPGLSKEDRTKVYTAMIDVLAKIHNVDIFQAGIDTYGKHENYVARQIKTWSRQYESSKTEEIPAMNTLMEWLPNNIPQQVGTSVVHGDFRVDNLIFDKDDYSKVLGVLDWELSTLGDPLTDVAYSCLPFYFPSDSAMLKGLAGLGIEELGILSEKECLERYLTSSKLDSVDDKTWDFYLSFGLFRISAILQGVYKRSLHKQASGMNARGAGQLTKTFSALSLEIAGRSSNVQAKRSFSTVLTRSSSTSNSNNRSFSTATASTSAQPGALVVSVSSLPERVQNIHRQVTEFVREEILPKDQEFRDHQESESWTVSPLYGPLKDKAKAAGLWNLFLPKEADPEGRYGAGLTNLEYAHICEVMGLSAFAPEVFNCSAPDTGNMEVLVKYGNEEHKARWLNPLLDGSIRSCFAMTEPKVASSDATNIQSSIVRDGDEYVINGHKWWTSGAMDPRCEICVFMGKTDTGAARHQQQSMVLVPFKSPGVKVVRPLSVYGTKDSPGGHAEVVFENVRVPVDHILLGEGRGFEIAQGRLGPGRIHHCMRLIGMAERCLELMIERAQTRVAFGKPLVDQGSIQQDIALCRVEIEQARLLTLKAAHLMDTVGNKVAAPEIAMIKIVAPRMVQTVADRAIQVHGGAGLSNDFPLAQIFGWARALRFADGPDEVHLRALFRHELNKHK